MSPSEERGKWYWVRDELTGDVCIINPAGTEYEISAPRLAQLDRGTVTLLNDMLDDLIDLQKENEALRARDALRDQAEGQSAFDLQAQVEALKAARAADKAGFDVVIRELREEVARLKGRGSESRNPDVVFGISSLNITQDPRAAEGIARARSRAKMKGGAK